MFAAIYTWQGSRHVAHIGTEADAEAHALEMRRKGWRCWVETWG